MKKPIRLGLIGCGGIVQITHARAYRALTDTVQVTALADVVPENLQKLAICSTYPQKTDTPITARCWHTPHLMS